jgi:hypothetical protein
MSRHIPDDENPKARYLIYGCAIGLAAVLVVVMLATYRGQSKSEAALAKADELNANFEAAGLPTRDRDVIASVLGSKGGAVCDDPGDLSRAMLKLTWMNGAAGPGMRPVRVDRVVVQAERVIIETYCPDELDEFDEFVDSIKFYDTSHS